MQLTPDMRAALYAKYGLDQPIYIQFFRYVGNMLRGALGVSYNIDCIAIEDEYGNTPAQRAELDWLLWNKPLEYAQLVLGGGMEHYLSLGCDHGRLED